MTQDLQIRIMIILPMVLLLAGLTVFILMDTIISRQQRRVFLIAEAFAFLWEKGVYDRSMQKQLDVVIRSLRKTLEEYDILDIFEMNRGSMRIVPERIDCDLYRFMQGDREAISTYYGQYMNSYSWAREMEAWLDRQKQSGE